MQSLSYNYIIAGGADYYQTIYSDLMGKPGVVYYPQYISGIPSPFKQLLTRFNFNIILNRYCTTPLSRWVYPWLYPCPFDDGKPLCFLFFECQYAIFNTSYLEYLRRRYPGVKLVLFMQDVVSSLPYYPMEQLKDRFDLILSFDSDDCQRYQLSYHPTPYSIIQPAQWVKQPPVDVYFCGAVKSRYPALMALYRRCMAEGLTCRFIMNGAPRANRVKGDGLIYDRPVSYMTNLSHVQSARCLVEIIQRSAKGSTLRLWEALFFDKLLLTNSTVVRNQPFYNPSFIRSLDDARPLADWLTTAVTYEDRYRRDRSPIRLLESVDHILTASQSL